MKKKLPYKRVLLKLSGEILMNSPSSSLDPEACLNAARAIKTIRDTGLEVAVVIGGGNIFRGVKMTNFNIERTPADQMGMLATLMNGLVLQQTLEKLDCSAKVMSALECPRVAESYNWHQALNDLSQGKVVIFVGGTGNPYFTTDTAAALRASEIKADSVFDQDPFKHSKAKKYDTITYQQVLAQKLEVMDATAIAMCMNNKIPILVFNMQLLNKLSIDSILLRHQQQGTLIEE
jgi:uridylate kinase